MGRGRGRGRGGKASRHLAKDFGSRGRRPDEWSEQPSRDNWNLTEPNKDGACQNPAFEVYYQTQGICPEEEWPAFIRALESPLPITFRINGSGRFAAALRARLEKGFLNEFAGSGGAPLKVDGEEVAPPQPLDWYPGGLAWAMKMSRQQLRKVPQLKALHEFVKRETDAGSISRQEAVSMVPPLFLDVQPHHYVLDMCAAPGSKTFQLLEMLHAGPAPASGLVIANDSDARRCNLLAHQVKRMCSPCLLVTNHEGQRFPLVRPCSRARLAAHGAVHFDRILCDVPCSGDGTARKSPDMWRRWSHKNGNGLHSLQLQILLQACRLLKVGGRLVYSTCAFNPVEDEAVVAAAVTAAHGAMRLVDVSDSLPTLHRRPGLSSWKVHYRGAFYERWEDVEAAVNAEGAKAQPTMFPPPATAALHLERTMRFLPHAQDTGGFFVAVLAKDAECPANMAVPRHTPAPRPERAKSDAGPVKEAVEVREGGGGGRPAEEASAAAEEDRASCKAAAATAATADAGCDGRKRPSDGELGVVLPAHALATRPVKAARVAADCGGVEGAAPARSCAGARPVGGVVHGGGGVGGGGDGGGGTTGDAEAEDGQGTELRWEIRGGGRGRYSASGAGGHKGGSKWRGIDPIVPVTDGELLGPIADFYGIARAGFPLDTHIVTRCLDTLERPRRLYYVSDAVRSVLMHDEGEALKVTSAGLKVLDRQEVRDGSNPCIFRVSQEGLPFTLPHITRQLVHLSLAEARSLLTARVLRIPREVPYCTVRPPRPRSPRPEGPTQGHGAAATDTDAPVKTDGDARGGSAGGPEVAAAAEGEGVGSRADAPSGSRPVPGAPEAGGEVVTGRDAGKASDGSALGGDAAEPVVSQAALSQLAHTHAGCCVVMLEEEDARRLGLPTRAVDRGGCLAAEAPLALAAWRTRATLNVLVSKEECAILAERLDTLEAAAAATEEGAATW